MRLRPVEFMRLFEEFRADSWRPWRRVISRIRANTREVYVIAGRGSGKSRMAALLACCYGCRTYENTAPGETVYVGVFAPDRRQSKLTFDYVLGLLRSRHELERLIVRERRESIELSTGVTVEVITASKAAPRGRSYALCVVEEAAFLPTDDAAEPDVELIRAVKPGLARVDESLLAVVSSPYARRGILWKAAQRYGEPNSAERPRNKVELSDRGRVVYVRAGTSALNPSFDRETVERALSEDPSAAKAEYLAAFRSDVESFVAREAVEAVVVTGRRELPFVRTRGGRTVRYEAFVDPSGGSADSFTIAVGHREERDGQPVAVIDAVRERRPPFSPEAVVREFAKLLKTYEVSRVVGDRYAGDWPAEAFGRHGITYEAASKSKSEIYRDALAVINAGRIELLDHDRLVNQLVSLERRTSRGGRDSIDHAPGSRDDVANVVAGVAVRLVVEKDEHYTRATWGRRGWTDSDGIASVTVETGRGGPCRVVERRTMDEVEPGFERMLDGLERKARRERSPIERAFTN